MVYVFTPVCIWCKRNIANINFLYQSRKSNFQFVGLSLLSEGLQSYIAAEHIDFPVLEEPSADTVAAFRLIATPTTVVVSPQGRILAEWRGAYTGSIAGQIQKFFSLKLPGLVEVASSEPISSPSTPIEKGARTR